jgi:hypothetical protein
MEGKHIYLYDNRILPWKRPLEPGQRPNLLQHNGLTDLVEELGINVVNEEIGNFKVIASAVRYLAKIAFCSRDNPLAFDGQITSEVEKKILFVGGIEIYRKGLLPGTKINGYNLERQGKILVTTNLEEQYKSSDGLKKLIVTNKKDLNRIESILLGYKLQEEARRYI